MKFRLFVAVLVAVALGACGTGSPTTEDCASVSIQPQVVHMAVGQSQTFRVTGGWGSEDSYFFRISDPSYVNLEQTGTDAVKVTLVKAFTCSSNCAVVLTVGTHQCGSATALLYNP